MEQEDVALAGGTRLGQYTIVRLIAAGSMGMVYEAEHRAIGKRVALKVLSPRLAGAPNARVRFLHEAEVTARLQHPHIVDVTDRGDDGGHAYIVMELLRGEDLAQRLQRTGPIAAEEIVDIMLPICAAIGAAHKQGITHRDLKPSNVFLAVREGRVHPTVLDFGISTGNEAIAALDARTLSRAGAVVGTPYYLAPEQILDSRSASPASDQYALGVILYECLTGQRPFDGRDISAVFRTIRGGNARRPSAVRPEIPLALEEAALRAMKQSPRSRFGSVMEFGRALLPFASSRTRLLWEDAFAVTAGALPAGGGRQAPAIGRAAAAAVKAGAPTASAPLAAAAARRGSSPAIAAEAATPSPYVRTLTPEVQAIDDPVRLPHGRGRTGAGGAPGRLRRRLVRCGAGRGPRRAVLPRRRLLEPNAAQAPRGQRRHRGRGLRLRRRAAGQARRLARETRRRPRGRCARAGRRARARRRATTAARPRSVPPAGGRRAAGGDSARAPKPRSAPAERRGRGSRPEDRGRRPEGRGRRPRRPSLRRQRREGRAASPRRRRPRAKVAREQKATGGSARGEGDGRGPKAPADESGHACLDGAQAEPGSGDG